MMMNYVHYKTPGHISWKTTTVLLRGEKTYLDVLLLILRPIAASRILKKKKKN